MSDHGLGRIRAAGLDFDVTHISMNGGVILIEGARPGPVPAASVTSFCLIGADDVVVGQVVESPLEWPDVETGSILTICAPLALLETRGSGRRDGVARWGR